MHTVTAHVIYFVFLVLHAGVINSTVSPKFQALFFWQMFPKQPDVYFAGRSGGTWGVCFYLQLFKLAQQVRHFLLLRRQLQFHFLVLLIHCLDKHKHARTQNTTVKCLLTTETARVQWLNKVFLNFREDPVSINGCKRTLDDTLSEQCSHAFSAGNNILDFTVKYILRKQRCQRVNFPFPGAALLNC